MTEAPEIGPSEASPLWAYRSVISLVLGGLAGAVLLEVAWFGASGQRAASDQIPWVNLGVIGVLLPVVASRRWVLAGRNSVGRRMATILAAMEPAVIDPAEGPSNTDHQTGLVAGPASNRYHRPTCLLVVDKPFTAGERVVHERAGRRPCEMCSP